jgi:hypothetical protein
MKNNLASARERATLGALFAIIGFVFAIVAILPTSSQSAERKSKNRQTDAASVGKITVDSR